MRVGKIYTGFGRIRNKNVGKYRGASAGTNRRDKPPLRSSVKVNARDEFYISITYQICALPGATIAYKTPPRWVQYMVALCFV
jgi:hypothetical protein